MMLEACHPFRFHGDWWTGGQPVPSSVALSCFKVLAKGQAAANNASNRCFELQKTLSTLHQAQESFGEKSPMYGWPDPLHKDICRQALRVLQAASQVLPIQIVSPSLPLRFEDIVFRGLHGLCYYVLCGLITGVIQAP